MNRFIAAVALAALIAPISAHSAQAFFSDAKISAGNRLTAGTFDFSIAPQPLDRSVATTSWTIDMRLASSSVRAVYVASTTVMTGDAAFCDEIHTSAQLNGSPFGSGRLADFRSATTTLGSAATPDVWKFDISAPAASSAANSACSFGIVYDGRQADPYLASGGFSHAETATSTLYSWGFRINKIYYDVASDRGSDPANEWLEIYNQTDMPLDLGGWQICNDQNCMAIPTASSSTLIAPKGFAEITASSTTWDHWAVGDKVTPIVLDSAVSGWLAQAGGRVILKRPDGLVIDEADVASIPQGHILGRKPNGYDTDQASDFVDLTAPTLQLIYPDQSGTLVWFWNGHYTIVWTTDPPGPASGLKVDISFIEDIDGSQTITSADETVAIGTGLANTGSYDWVVPYGFYGYTWVAVTVFDPENPMLNARVISGMIFDPPMSVDAPMLDDAPPVIVDPPLVPEP